MIAPATLLSVLQRNGIGFYAGVPDSLLKEFLGYLADHAAGRHVIAANEGAAVALAVGHYLATGRPALVYMQNSGLGNAINPLVSLADQAVYSIPMLLLIGWRGEPGTKDEPQHQAQGQITPELLQLLKIPHVVLDADVADVEAMVAQACDTARRNGNPSAILVRKGAFETYESCNSVPAEHPLTREGAIRVVLGTLGPDDVLVSTTGKTSREVYECREALGMGHDGDFLTIGSMGHASQIALGIALRRPDRQVYCLDGDGSVLMHMGSLAVIGSEAPPNYKHVLLNNGAHDSVGGQPTAGFRIDFCAIARACGYPTVLYAREPEEVGRAMERLNNAEGPAFLEIRVNKGARKNLGRPTIAPAETKMRFMQSLSK